MNIDFPEDLLGSSLLKPIRNMNPGSKETSFILPEKRELFSTGSRPSTRYLEQSLGTKRIVLPSPFDHDQIDTTSSMAKGDALAEDTLVEQQRHCPLASSLNNSSIRKLQFELEKEKELYNMHTNAAVKSFERINVLVNELARFLTHGSDESMQSTLSKTALSDIPNANLELPCSNPKCHEGIKDVSITVRPRFFSRKPRCLSFPGLESHEDLMATSSLDGIVQYCSMKSRAVTRSFHLPSLLGRPCHAEAMCTVDEAEGFLISTVDASPASGQRANDPDPINSPSSIIFLPYPHRDTTLPKIVDSPPNNPHQKAISTIVKFQEVGAGSGTRVKFLTGGLDKNVALWELGEEQSVVGVHEVHKIHTSAVQAITQVKARPEVIWTGGADCRLVGWSIGERRSTFSNRFTNRISHLQVNEQHPHCILVTFCSLKDQLRLLDSRAPLSQTFRPFGHDELSSTSRYLRSSWSRGGYLIAMGTSAPQSRIPAINVWDIRYLRNDSAPMRAVECGLERRFLACDFWPFGDTIVALGSDCSASFVDFTTS